MAELTTKQEIKAINGRLDRIEQDVSCLNKIEITMRNGKEKHITYRRNEFFQMLYDRKNVWKDHVRCTAKDFLLFGGVAILIFDRIFAIL